MQLQRAPIRLAPAHDRRLSGDRARIAAVLILVGSACQVLRLFLPWLEKSILAISLTNFDSPGTTIALVTLAVVAGGIAVYVFVRPPARAGVASLLILLALGQLGVALWHGYVFIHGIADDSHAVWAEAIGTGLYLCVIGAMTSLCGGVLAWTSRLAPSTRPATRPRSVDRGG
jgi:hypothetical protein